MQKVKNLLTVLGEFRGGFTVFPKCFGGFTVFGIPLGPPPGMFQWSRY